MSTEETEAPSTTSSVVWPGRPWLGESGTTLPTIREYLQGVQADLKSKEMNMATNSHGQHSDLSDGSKMVILHQGYAHALSRTVAGLRKWGSGIVPISSTSHPEISGALIGEIWTDMPNPCTLRVPRSLDSCCGSSIQRSMVRVLDTILENPINHAGLSTRVNDGYNGSLYGHHDTCTDTEGREWDMTLLVKPTFSKGSSSERTHVEGA